MRWLLLCALVAWSVPGWGGAAQLRVGVRSGASYDSNVRNSAANEEAGTDASGAVQLDLSSEQSDDVTWRLRYEPRFQKFFGNRTDLDNWRHRVQGDMRYEWSKATAVSSQFSYNLNERNTRNADDVFQADPTLPLTSGNDQVERLQLGGALSHRFTSRWSGTFAVAHAATSFDQPSSSDSESTNLSSGLHYAISRRQTLGGGVSFSEQNNGDRVVTGDRFVVGDLNGNPSVQIQGVSCDLSGVPPIPPGGSIRARVACTVQGQDTQFVQVFGSWSVALSPRWSFNLRAGPTHIRPSTGKSNTTLFATMGLTRRARQSSWSAGFSRTESGAFGTAVSTVVNVFRTSWRWKPSEYWGVTLAGTYSRRESVQQNDDRTIDVYTAALQANRRLTRRLTGVWILTYRDQRNNSSIARTDAGFNSLETGLSVQYAFDPVIF